jgi:arabinan endo-1,5-alpha-L-arabinosidase
MATRPKAVTPGFEPVEPRRLLSAPGLGSVAAVVRPAAQAPAPAAVDPGAVAGVTDPSLIKEGDTYYVFSSGPGIDVRSSTDLIHWQRLGQVFAAVPAWALAKVPGATEIWAPDVSFFGGQYHLYYAVSTFGSQRSVIGQATNTTLDPTVPGYQWVDRGEVIESRPGRDNFNAIDPTVSTDGASAWLTFGSQWTGIKQVRLDSMTGLPARARSPRAARLVSLASQPGGQPIEAPFVFPRGGRYYLFVSIGSCCMGTDSTYEVVVGRSRSPGGPYLDRSGRPMTRGGGTLVLAGSGRWRGPGSEGVLSDGGLDWLVVHAYDAQNDGTPTLQVRPLFWTPDGWPVAGPPLF